MQLCITCKTAGRLSDNYAWCSKECRSVYEKARYAKDAAKIRRQRKAWRDENPDRYGVIKQRRNAKRYGLTLEQVEQLTADQLGRCAVCFDEFEGTPYVHHNHASGEVVALLCLHCNSAEGFLKGDPERARALARFMERNRSMIDGEEIRL